VLIGGSAFVAAVAGAEANGSTNSINITRGVPFGVQYTGTPNHIFIATNTMTLRAGKVIAQQNTGLLGQQSGVDLTNANHAAVVLTLGATGTTAPSIIDLFLNFTDAGGVSIGRTVAAVSAAIQIDPPLSNNNSYRINGCAIHVAGQCTPLPDTVYTLNVANLIEGVRIASEDVAPTDDPTITGSGNEEIWRQPSCDPKGGAKCP
jgi:hypothetical protein